MSTGPVQRALDTSTDGVLAYQPDKPDVPAPKHWSITVDRIFADSGLRLDASRFDPDLERCLADLKASGLQLTTLDDLADIQLPGRFERVWAKDHQNGLPYLNATDLLSLFAIGMPSNTRYLSHKTEVDIDALIIRQNWLLMTCSGTIGRLFHVPQRLDGWAATHDLIRIKPQAGMVGYLFAWCMTSTAQTQILSHTHGGQIDHVSDSQVGGIIVPMLPDEKARSLDRTVLKALRAREQGLKQLENLWPAG